MTVDMKTSTLPPTVNIDSTSNTNGVNTTSTGNGNTYQSHTVSSIANIQMLASVLLCNRAIQTMYWILKEYHAYTYAYDTHFTLNNYETKTYSPTYSTLDFAVSFQIYDTHKAGEDSIRQFYVRIDIIGYRLTN